MIENKLGNRIRLQRIKQGMSQPQLAKALNITSQTIGNYEKGDRIPDAILLKKMAVTFSCSTDYLLGLSNAMHPENANIVDNIGLSEENIHKLKCLDKRYPPPHGASIGGILSMFNSLIAASSFKDLLFHLDKLSTYSNREILSLETKEIAANFKKCQQHIQHDKSEEFDFTPDLILKFEKMRLDDTIESLVQELRIGYIYTLVSTIDEKDPMAFKAILGDKLDSSTL